MKPLLTATLTALSLTACATRAAPPAPPTMPPAPPPAEAALGKLPPPIPAIPYPKLNPQDQIDRLGIQISRLQQQIDLLNSRVQQLERRSSTPTATRTPRVAPATRRHSTNSSSISAADSAQAAYIENAAAQTLAQAQAQFRSGNYREAANILRNSESGGSGSDVDRQSMFLLMQSHLKLGNCESAINIGNRLATRFRSSRGAPEALIGIGQCQYRMQQKDIARDTWRKLMQTYPESSAAKRAVELLKK